MSTESEIELSELSPPLIQLLLGVRLWGGYPAILIEMSMRGDEGVQRAIQELENQGWLCPSGRGPHRILSPRGERVADRLFQHYHGKPIRAHLYEREGG